MKKMKMMIAATLLVGTLGTSISAYAAPSKTITTNNTVSAVAKTSNGWQQSGSKWYYYQNGKKTVGWKKISGKWYYFNSSGVMQTGWKKIAGKWYYLKNGVMQTGWKKISGKWYFFNASGVMQTGTVRINKRNYTFDKNGVWINEFYNPNWNIKSAEDGAVHVIPYHVYYKGDTLIAKCYIANTTDCTITEIHRIKYLNLFDYKNQMIASGTFSNVKLPSYIGPNQYVWVTLTFNADSIYQAGADLSELSSSFGLNYSYIY